MMFKEEPGSALCAEKAKERALILADSDALKKQEG